MEVIAGMNYQQLDERGKELTELMRRVDHCPERKEQIQHELSIIAFELWCQYDEGKIEFAQL